MVILKGSLMATLDRSKENPWRLKTPPGSSEYTMHEEVWERAETK